MRRFTEKDIRKAIFIDTKDLHELIREGTAYDPNIDARDILKIQGYIVIDSDNYGGSSFVIEGEDNE